METKNIYAQGMYFNKNHPDTPEAVKKWKKGAVAINIEKFVAQLNELKSFADEKGYIKFDLTLNEKDGEPFYSFKLNTYKKEATVTASRTEDINPDDIPF